MKRTLLYLILAIAGLTAVIAGTIALISMELDTSNILAPVIKTLVGIGLFTFFGYAFWIHFKELK